MSQSDIDRLYKLKEVSEQLKDCTVNTPINIQKVKYLLSMTKEIHSKNQTKEPNFDRNSHIYQLTSNDNTFKPLFPESTSKVDLNHLNKVTEIQVIQLKEQNLSLEEKIKGMEKEIGKLQEEKLVLKAQGDNLPYFKLIETVQGFIGRLSIPIDNIEQLDYSSYQVELKLDRLVLLRKQKGSIQQFDLTTLKDAQYRSNIIMLKFTQFMSEKQKSQANVVLKFNTPEHLHKWDLSIFANYNLVNSLNQPRLLQNHFAKVKLQEQKTQQKLKIQELKNKKQLNKANQKDLLRLLIKKRQEYLQIKELISEKIQFKMHESQGLFNPQLSELGKFQGMDKSKQEKGKEINQEKEKQKEKQDNRWSKGQTPKKITAQNSRRSSKQSLLRSTNRKKSPIEQIVELDPHQQESDQGNPIQFNKQPQVKIFQPHHNNSSSFQSSMTNHIPLATLINSTSNQRQIDNRSQIFDIRSNIEPVTIYQNGNNRNTMLSNNVSNIYANTDSNRRKSQESIFNELNNSSMFNKRQLFQTNNLNSSMVSSFNPSKYNGARINLQNGYLATKYSKDGFNFHDKKVFMSLDCKKLCWSQKDKLSDYKSIPMQVITKMEYGVLGEGIIKHVKEPIAAHYCVIEYYTSDYKKKTIQLGSQDILTMKNFASDLNIIIKKLKQDASV